VARGADVNRDSQNGTPLHAAAREGSAEVAALLLEHGAKVNALHKGETPLARAIERRNRELAEVLLRAGADPNLGEAPLVYRAIEQRDADLVRLLLGKGADPNRGHMPTLYRAAESRDAALVRLLLAHKDDPNRASGDVTPLHRAVRNGDTEIAETLIAAGANVNARSEKYGTPLRLARDRKVPGLAELLARHGAKE
jgi:ankyrin repeat protein